MIQDIIEFRSSVHDRYHIKGMKHTDKQSVWTLDHWLATIKQLSDWDNPFSTKINGFTVPEWGYGN